MGLFLQTAIMPGGKEQEARHVVKTVAEKYSHELEDSFNDGQEQYIITDLIPDECQFKEYDKGVTICFNDECVGYEDLAKAMSKESGSPVMVLYIYDGDYWGYFLYDNGVEIDQFNPVPDYFDGVTEEEWQKVKGNAEIIAQYFHVEQEEIEKYLVFWSEYMEDEEKAYEDDEFGRGEDWQMADFMRKLGCPYDSE